MVFIEKPKPPPFKHRPMVSEHYLKYGSSRFSGLYFRSYKYQEPVFAQLMEGSVHMPSRTRGHIIGWRSWGGVMTDEGPRLIGPVTGIVWKPHEPCVGIALGTGLAGINAYDEEHDSNSWRGGAQYYGRVALWGKVEEYEEGYRAEFGYPLTLNTRRRSRNSLPILLLMLETYGIQPEVSKGRGRGGGFDIQPTCDPLTGEPV